MRTMSYEEFEKYINILKSKYAQMDKIGEVLQWDDVYELGMGEQVVELLSYIFNDTDDWISYWVYEKTFGKEWKEGCATEADGTDIDLSTTKKLYDFLVSNMK
jgi:hypothetical protein